MKVLNPYFYALNPDILAYENAWMNYMKTGERNVTVNRDIIWESWERCKNRGFEPFGNFHIPNVGEKELFRRIGKNQEIVSIVSQFIDTIYKEIQGPGFLVLFTDDESVVLKCECDEELNETGKGIGLILGANMAEDFVGTNSIDLAVNLRKPNSVTGAEHYSELFHNLTSASVPIFDYSGKLLGVLSIWGKHEHTSPHILSILISTAKAIENEMQIKKINEQLIENNNQLGAILESVSDGVVYVKNGIITQVNRKMLQLLGKSSTNLDNQSIENAVITSPEIKNILSNQSQTNSFKTTLYGAKKSYNCIVSKNNVRGSSGNEIGQVLIFMEAEEINKLAKTINKNVARWTFEDIIGEAAPFRDAIAIAKRAAEHNSRIVIQGESGTGKEMFAQAIHNASDRRNHPFVAIDCGAIPGGLFESILFGYEKGAFTGAKEKGSVGAFETASKGTVFLDEVENLPLEMQVKLLRVLQEKVITRVGSATPIPMDVRIIAATNVDLQQLVHAGDFREDLFYRLNVVNINTPPLRERRGDIALLVNNYLEKEYSNGRQLTVEKSAMEVLQKYDWPGNIRQLYNVIERAGIMTNGKTIKVNDLPLEILHAVGNRTTMENRIGSHYEGCTLNEMTRKYIMEVLAGNGNNVSKAARVLDVSRTTIYKAINQKEGEKS